MKPEFYIQKITNKLELKNDGWVTSKNRSRETSTWPRQFLIYCLLKYEHYTERKAANYCGGRDHATANHSKKTVTNLLENDKIFRSIYLELDNEFCENHKNETATKKILAHINESREYENYYERTRVEYLIKHGFRSYKIQHQSKRKNNLILQKYR